MNKNIKLLYVTNSATTKDYDLQAAIDGLELHKVITVEGSKAAIKEFINEYKTQPFQATLICELPHKEEVELLKALMEADPDQYIILLYQEITADKVLNAVKHGAAGVLSAPFTADKLRLELEKYSLLREEKRAFNE
jgi:DNA-binding NtrC family response regulator